MAIEEPDQQINLPSLAVILVISGLIIRYLFFSSSSPNNGAGSSSSAAGGRRSGTADPAALVRSREAAVERIQQMFPQVERRAVLWDLQRTGGSVQTTTERILAGRLETPPVTFQPPPPPGSSNNNATPGTQTPRPADRPAQPDLITRYNLQDKVNAPAIDSANSSGAETGGSGSGSGSGKQGKVWSTNRDERQSLLQKRRDQMILEARRKMEAKIAAEKAAQGS